MSGATIDRSSVLAEAQGAGEPEREGRLRRDLRRHLFAYALIAPALVLLALLIAYPSSMPSTSAEPELVHQPRADVRWARQLPCRVADKHVPARLP